MSSGRPCVRRPCRRMQKQPHARLPWVQAQVPVQVRRREREEAALPRPSRSTKSHARVGKGTLCISLGRSLVKAQGSSLAGRWPLASRATLRFNSAVEDRQAGRQGEGVCVEWERKGPCLQEWP